MPTLATNDTDIGSVAARCRTWGSAGLAAAAPNAELGCPWVPAGLGRPDASAVANLQRTPQRELIQSLPGRA